ncbi:glycosyltransferase family 39 protein, partial [Candidatus Roizmanbacteria bacterium]|nr:glycosyltransferase family 39 protein [Candidatus Roizmanbacteria bacterium]
MEKKKLVLVLILLVAFFSRFYRIGSIPPALTWDEVSWGYNAYALGTDGRDEFGRFLPITYLESFGDYKPPLYAYLAILPVKLFGLTEFAVRIPSALFGFLTVLITYFLVKEIFYIREKNDTITRFMPLFTTAFLAISPWHINLS